MVFIQTTVTVEIIWEQYWIFVIVLLPQVFETCLLLFYKIYWRSKEGMQWNLRENFSDPRGRPTVMITIFTHVVCLYFGPSVRAHFSKSCKTKQIASENNVRYWHDCWSGRVDHWWHLSSSFSFSCLLP